MRDIPKRETAKARQAFEDYWELGPDRSLAKLAAGYKNDGKRGVSVRQLERWSVAFHWQERVTERDREIAIAQFEREKGQRVEDREQNLMTARALVRIVQQAIRYVTENDTAHELSMSLFPQYLKVATEIMRLESGESTENTAVAVRQDNEMDDLIQERMRNDPEFAAIASEFFERLTMAEDDVG